MISYTLCVYFAISFIMFMNFALGTLNFKIMNSTKNEEVEIPNWLRGLLVSMLSVAWPVICIHFIIITCNRNRR